MEGLKRFGERCSGVLRGGGGRIHVLLTGGAWGGGVLPGSARECEKSIFLEQSRVETIRIAPSLERLSHSVLRAVQKKRARRSGSSNK